MEVFQLLDNNPLLGHYRVKMALDSLGYRYGHTTVWQMVALYKQAHLPSRARSARPTRTNGLNRPRLPIRSGLPTCGIWSRSTGTGSTASSSSTAIAAPSWEPAASIGRTSRGWSRSSARPLPSGARLRPSSVTMGRCLWRCSPVSRRSAIQWAPITKGHPWQNLAEGGFSVQRRMLDAYVVGCTDRETVYRQHAQFVHDYQFWGHWAHKRTDAQGRLYYVSPEVILANAKGRAHRTRAASRRVFRLRQLTRQVRQHGQIRLHNFGLYVDRGLWGQTVEVLIYDEALRIEQAEHLLVSYPCVYDTTQRRITAVAEHGRQQYRSFPVVQLMLWALEIMHDRVADAALSTVPTSATRVPGTPTESLRWLCTMIWALGHIW